MLPKWIASYKRSDIKSDIMAGLTVGVIIIPQGMAYAMLAGLPPIYGLYASTIPLFIYALFGTSRHLSVGPVAIDSMLTAAAVGAIAVTGTQEYISLAIFLALMVGSIQFILGISRLGFLVKFLSNPVIHGFTSAAAIVIALSQLKYLLGIEMTSSPYLHEVIISLIQRAHEVQPITLLIGVAGIVSLLLLRKYAPVFPAALIIVFLATLTVGIFRLDLLGIRTIGDLPSGIPLPEVPAMNLEAFRRLLPSAFAIALISFMESLSIARSLQAKHKNYRIDSNKELLSLGLANMIGSFFRSFPVSGGFSRSAVNEQAGARSGLSSIVTALLVVCALLVLTPLFYYMPNVILAAIIVVAVIKLIHLAEAKYLWKVDKKDFIMMMVTFFATLFLGIGTGISIGVILSLAWIIFETSYPHHAQLGRVPGTRTYRNIRRFKELIIENDVMIFRFDAPLFFANADRFRDILLNYIASSPTRIQAIIVDMESTNNIDTSAITVLEETINEIRHAGIKFLFAELKGPVRDKLWVSGLTKKIGEENFFMTIDQAIEYLNTPNPEHVNQHIIQADKG